MLTQMLIPIMQKSSQPARIVNVGSFTHYCGMDISAFVIVYIDINVKASGFYSFCEFDP